MADENREGVIVSALEDIYGDDVSEAWEYLREKHPDLSSEELVRKWQSDPTCDCSSFERESNIRVLAKEVLGKETNRNWRILCVGCGSGPEPYELTMRLLESGHRRFTVEGIDVSDEAIERAKKGEIVHDEDFGSFGDRDFLQEMERAGMIKKGEESRKKRRRPQRSRLSRYELTDEVRSRMNFSTHDIIDSPYGKPQSYDAIVCNNLLMHFPVWTRELILAHILRSLKDGGIVVLEHNERLWGMGATPERIAWLKPYYDWKSDLSKFGLHPEEVISEDLFVPTKFFRYRSNENQFKDKNLGIRNKKLIELG